MLDRYSKRTIFWLLVAATAVLSGVSSVGHAMATIGVVRALPMLTAVLPGRPEAAAMSSAAPALSLVALAMAVGGWVLLARPHAAREQRHKLLARRAARLEDAMHANSDGMFLLRAVRDRQARIIDFEIDDANEVGAHMLRSTRERLLGRRIVRDASGALALAPFTAYVAALEHATPINEEVRVNRRIMAARWLMHRAVAIDEGLAVTLRDISARKREEHDLRRASVTDDLTGLYNRRAFTRIAAQHIHAAREQSREFALLYVDMDEFKSLNDTFGHHEGDRALRAVGRLLRSVVRDCDIVARLGGDEFSMLAMGADAAVARSIQRRIEQRVAQLNATHVLATPVSLTVGYTCVRPTDHAPLDELLARADALLYSRKKRRKAAALSAAHASARSSATVPSAPARPAKAAIAGPRARVAARPAGPSVASASVARPRMKPAAATIKGAALSETAGGLIALGTSSWLDGESTRP